MKSILLLITLITIAITIFCWPTTPAPIAGINPVSVKQSSKAVKFAQQAHDAFSEGGFKQLRPFMVKMDRDGYKDQIKVMESLKQLKFAEAIVNSPQFNENLLYVNLTTADKRQVIFTLKAYKNRLKLNSVCVN